MPLSWFKDRIGKDITVTFPTGKKGTITIQHEKQAAWLHEAQQHTYNFNDIDPFESHFDTKVTIHRGGDTCVSCEG